jgi:hypothetical protein
LDVESGSKRKLGVLGRTSLPRMAKAREGGPEVVRPRRRRVKELSRGSKSFTSETPSRWEVRDDPTHGDIDHDALETSYETTTINEAESKTRYIQQASYHTPQIVYPRLGA